MPGDKFEFDLPPEDLGSEAPAPTGVEAFVEQKLGLEVLTAFGKGSTGRRRSKPPLYFESVRELTIDDAVAMQNAPARKQGETGGTSNLQRIRTVHHQIARMLATGEKDINVSRILGVTPARIQQLKNDPAFSELLQHYKDLDEEADISLKQRFYLLGTAGMEELQERILDAPDSFGNGHLMDLVKLTIGGEAPRQAPAKGDVNTLTAEALEALKAGADAQARSRVAYRTPSEEGAGSKGEASDGEA